MMQILDTHQHLWDLDLFTYSWLGSLPSLNRSFRMADYLQATTGLNVAKSVHLEADVDEPYMLDETRHLLARADRADNPLEGIVACGRPESKEFRSYLNRRPRETERNPPRSAHATRRVGPGRRDLHCEHSRPC